MTVTTDIASSWETPPVPVYQWPEEIAALLDIYRQRKPRRVLEVGTYHGGTLYHWLRNTSGWARVVSIDSYAVGVDNRALYPGWAPPGVECVAVAGDSRDADVVAQAGEHGPYDWIFIDAGHRYEEVAADWRNYRPFAAAGSLVVFHDILPPSAAHPEIEVERLWREIQRAGYLTREIVADPAAEWGGLGLVYMEARR